MKRRLAMVPALAALLLLMPAVSPVAALDEADRLFMVGDKAMADRFYPVARRTLDRFVTQYPRDARAPKALLMLGKARVALDDAAGALDALTRAQPGLSAPAEQLEAKFWEAEALFRLKRFSEARPAYDHVVKTDAASEWAPNALYGFAWSELELKHPQAAVTALRDLLTAWPQHALAAQATLQLARAHIELKHVNEAVPLLTGFASQYPGSKLIPDAQFLLGWVKVNNGDPRGGADDLRAFVKANPNHDQVPEAQRLINQTAGKHGTRAERLAAYKTLMAEDPPTVRGLTDALDIARDLGQPKDVEAAWRKLKAAFPADPRTQQLALQMASTAFNKQKNWKEAAGLAQIATQSSDDTVRAEAFLLVGESELNLKRFPPAAKAFEAVGTISGVSAEARYRALAGLGVARENLKEWRAALTAYEAVAKGSPDATLQGWARDRVAAVKRELPAASNGKPADSGSASPGSKPKPDKPADKPTGKKS